jgi:hypothetical protein
MTTPQHSDKSNGKQPPDTIDGFPVPKALWIRRPPGPNALVPTPSRRALPAELCTLNENAYRGRVAYLPHPSSGRSDSRISS